MGNYLVHLENVASWVNWGRYFELVCDVQLDPSLF